MVSSTTEAWCSRLCSGESRDSFWVASSKQFSSLSMWLIYEGQHAMSQNHLTLVHKLVDLLHSVAQRRLSPSTYCKICEF